MSIWAPPTEAGSVEAIPGEIARPFHLTRTRQNVARNGVSLQQSRESEHLHKGAKEVNQKRSRTPKK